MKRKRIRVGIDCAMIKVFLSPSSRSPHIYPAKVGVELYQLVIAGSIRKRSSEISVSGVKNKKRKETQEERGRTYCIHNLDSPSQPFIFTQILLMPPVQLLYHRSHPSLLPSRRKHDPGSRYLFIGKTSAANASNRNIVDKLVRMVKETILNFDRGYLGTGDLEGILNFE